MDGKIRKTPHEWAKHVEFRDIRCLRIITWKLLRAVESSAELYIKATPTELIELEKRHNLLFGKTPLAATLVMLGELLLKLNQKQSERPDDKVEEKEQAHPFSDFDIALVENFIRDEKLRPNTVASVYHRPTPDLPVHTYKQPEQPIELDNHPP